MRLINARTLHLEEYFGGEIPVYAILSHTWGKDEITFEAFGTALAAEHESYQKIKSTCELAITQGHYYVWVDTCCIDKRSSAELSEAINSMCAWYQKSSICYAYLVDVDKGDMESFPRSRWWTRGWTLQELLAPSNVMFLDKNWNNLGTKTGMRKEISDCTGIMERAMISLDIARSMSIAERMSWASQRSTTRVEDRAYSLLGLFDVNMPLLYGEGLKAFVRLQEEILKISADQSIFAWGLVADTNLSFQQLKDSIPDTDPLSPPDHYSLTGPLAPFPELFEKSCGVRPISMTHKSTQFGMTNLGIQIQLPIADAFTAQDERGCINYCIGVLACSRSKRDGEFVGILLRRAHENQLYARLSSENGAKSTFLFNTRHVLNATVRDLFLIKLPGAKTESNLYLQLGGEIFERFPSSLAISVDPELKTNGLAISRVCLNGHSHVSPSKVVVSDVVDSPYSVVLLADWRELNKCDIFFNSAMSKDTFSVVVNAHSVQQEDSFCVISLPTVVSGALSILKSKDTTTKLQLGESKTVLMRKTSEGKTLEVKIKTTFHSNTVLLQRIFIVALSLAP